MKQPPVFSLLWLATLWLSRWPPTVLPADSDSIYVAIIYDVGAGVVASSSSSFEASLDNNTGYMNMSEALTSEYLETVTNEESLSATSKLATTLDKESLDLSRNISVSLIWIPFGKPLHFRDFRRNESADLRDVASADVTIVDAGLCVDVESRDMLRSHVGPAAICLDPRQDIAFISMATPSQPRTCNLSSTLTDSLHGAFYPVSTLHDVETDITLQAILHLQWKSVTIFYDRALEARMEPLLLLLSGAGVKFLQFLVSSQGYWGDLNATLRQSYSTSNNFLLLCSHQVAHRILLEANIYDARRKTKSAFRHQSRWLLLSTLDSEAWLTSSELELDNVAVLIFPSFPSPSGNRQVMRTRLESVLHVVSGQFTDDLEHLAEGTAPQRDDFLRKLSQTLNEGRPCWRSAILSLLWRREGQRELGVVAMVNTSRVLPPATTIFPNSQYGFNGRRLLVATNTYYPFVMKTEVNGSLVYTGFCMDLLQELAVAMNFSYDLVEPADGEWGRIINGSWTGLVGQLEKQEVDLMVAPLIVSAERLAVMDFSSSFFNDYTTVVYRRPDPNKNKWRKLVEPLKWQVLLCLGVALLLVPGLFYVMESVNPHYSLTSVSHQPLNIYQYFYGAMLNQGGSHRHTSMSSRTLLACWWLFCIMVAATYSGNLIAFLTVAKDKPPFSSLAALVAQTEYTWGTLGGSIWVHQFSTSNKSEYQRLGKGMERFSATDPDVFSLDQDTHLNKVLAGGYAYIADRSSMELWVAEHCELLFIDENFYPTQYAIGLPKQSQYTKTFSDQMLRVSESGLLQIWRQRWWPQHSLCLGSLVQEAKKIELADIQSAFYMMAAGTILAIIAVLIELVVSTVRRRCKARLELDLVTQAP